MSARRLAICLLFLSALLPASALSQSVREPKLPVAWNRFYDYDGIVELCRRLADAHPELCRLEFIGPSAEGRPMPLLTLTDPAGGAEADKPAMWVDGNVHGNEVQGAEAAVYLAWFLAERQGELSDVDALLAETVFYILPMVNPDGRQHWFEAANNAHSSRSGMLPFDNDGDGVADEDGYDDLDGDGHITRMRKRVEPGSGTHILAPDDPRILLRVAAEERVKLGADWISLGSEGFDNDGDGRNGEDGPGGYDMNRNWPGGWQPRHIQFGAGDYPFSFPETAAIGEFIMAHPRIAAVQSFHNAGGMLLRGPGAEARQDWYPSADRRVYEAIGADGEDILPHYRYLVIFKDLYDVHGGFVTWTHEGLGIISFTNELWNSDQLFGRSPARGEAGERERLFFDDHLMLGETFVDWHEVEHPQYGTVEVGGAQKMTGRTPPAFMIEEMLHRNAAFCMFHAAQLPKLEAVSLEVEHGAGGSRIVTASFRNLAGIPTRTAVSADKGIGRPDLVSIEGDGLVVVAGGPGAGRFDLTEFDAVEHEPARLRLDRGVEGHGTQRLRWVVTGSGPFTVTYDSVHGGRVMLTGEL
ncbi:MAG: peptidase M14 [Planctomycetota bacterium]|nr:MAG: peptidase M14 [Planctomycetota bacterium]